MPSNNNNETEKEVQAQYICGEDRLCCLTSENCMMKILYHNGKEVKRICGCDW